MGSLKIPPFEVEVAEGEEIVDELVGVVVEDITVDVMFDIILLTLLDIEGTNDILLDMIEVGIMLSVAMLVGTAVVADMLIYL